jgi:hypothetical protein
MSWPKLLFLSKGCIDQAVVLVEARCICMSLIFPCSRFHPGCGHFSNLALRVGGSCVWINVFFHFERDCAAIFNVYFDTKCERGGREKGWTTRKSTFLLTTLCSIVLSGSIRLHGAGLDTTV